MVKNLSAGQREVQRLKDALSHNARLAKEPAKARVALKSTTGAPKGTPSMWTPAPWPAIASVPSYVSPSATAASATKESVTKEDEDGNGSDDSESE